jgi:hypothetical protein
MFLLSFGTLAYFYTRVITQVERLSSGLKLLKRLLYITIVFWNSCLVYSSTFTPTPVSLPTWNVYQVDCSYFDIWITKQLFRNGNCMGRGRVLIRGFLVYFPLYAWCVDLLCVLACVERVVLVSGVEVRVRLKLCMLVIQISKYQQSIW